MDKKLFKRDPRSFALELVEQGFSAERLLEACLVYMSTDEVRDMLDANELSPRFSDEDEDEDEDDRPDYYDEVDEAQEWYDFDPEC